MSLDILLFLMYISPTLTIRRLRYKGIFSSLSLSLYPPWQIVYNGTRSYYNSHWKGEGCIGTLYWIVEVLTVLLIAKERWTIDTLYQSFNIHTIVISFSCSLYYSAFAFGEVAHARHSESLLSLYSRLIARLLAAKLLTLGIVKVNFPSALA